MGGPRPNWRNGAGNGQAQAPAGHAARQTAAGQVWSLAAVAATLAVMALSAAAFDARTLDGVGVWAKPLKFSLSFVLFFATVALALPLLSDEARGKAWLRAALLAMGVSFLAEMAYIFGQAARGEASHFNMETPVLYALYLAMGVGATLIVLGAGAVGLALRGDQAPRGGPALRSAVVWGFAGMVPLVLVTAFTLSAGQGHFVGTPGPDAAVLPLLGWSASVGDLRPAHFLALHAMQAIPLLGWLADRRGWPVAVVPAGFAVWTALTLAVFVQALMGLPLIRL